MIRLELTPELYNNLKVLIVAGAKSPHTDEMAVMAGAQMLRIMAQAKAAAEAAPKSNGVHAEDNAGA